MIFYKYYSNNNDYLIHDYDKDIDYKKLAIKVLDKTKGIKADYLIAIKKDPLEAFIYDSCGNKIKNDINALSASAKYIYLNRYNDKNEFGIISSSTLSNVEIVSEIPFKSRITIKDYSFKNNMLYISDLIDSFGRALKIDNSYINFYGIYLAGIHAVIIVDEFSDDYLKLAETISKNKLFERGCNVSFVKIHKKTEFSVKTYTINEGFVDFYASGAAAAFCVCNKLNLLANKANLRYFNDYLEVSINRKGIHIDAMAYLVAKIDYFMEEK